MSTPRKGRGKSGSRKHGRNKVKCALYRAQNRREKNKLRKLKKLSKKQPNNKQIPKLIKQLEG